MASDQLGRRSSRGFKVLRDAGGSSCDDRDIELASMTAIEGQVNGVTVAEDGWKLKLRLKWFFLFE